MKHIKTINEIFGIRGLFKKDESTAKGILKKMTDDLIINIGPKRFVFEIGEFEIMVNSRYETWRSEWGGRRSKLIGYTIYIDGVELNTTDNIAEKIAKRCFELISNQEEIAKKKETADKDEMDNFIKKDAKIYFKK